MIESTLKAFIRAYPNKICLLYLLSTFRTKRIFISFKRHLSYLSIHRSVGINPLSSALTLSKLIEKQ